ncbi:MAG: DNA polymerase III subunit alpha [Atribacterota bacterium]
MSNKQNFVHLHVHSEFSLLDGACRIKDLIAKAKRCNMPALALTDHGVMYGVIQFYKEAVANNIKPIIGCEMYVSPHSRKDKSNGKKESPSHLILLVKNKKGYQNLIQLVTKSFLEGFYYKPRIDKKILSEYSEGLVGLSACLKGEIPRMILQNNYQAAEKLAITYQEIFGKEDFYLEVQNNTMPEQIKVNQQLVKLSRSLKIPLVATNDVHYMNREDREAHDILLCIQTATNLDDPNRMKLSTDEFYFNTPEEMQQHFSDIPEALENTVEIAQKCNLQIDFSNAHLPDFNIPEKLTDNDYLRQLCYEGAKNKFKNITTEINERLDYELTVINKMGFATYFLIVWDFVNYAKKHHIMVGPGRGSAAGSLIAYCLNITNINPLDYNLLFERFLNPERISMPDFDIDFSYEGRGEVIEYVSKKYGRDKVSQIITFGTMAARAVIRDVGRALGIPYGQVDKIAKLIPMDPKMTIEKALQIEPELKNRMENDAIIKKMIEVSSKLEGLSRHASTHAAGVVLSKEPLTHFVPLQLTSDGEVSTQYAAEELESLGLLKMDFLGLRTLSVINNTLKIIRNTRKENIDIDNIPLNDKKVYQLLSRGDCCGLFQLESSGMIDLVKRMEPQNIEDITALLALFRPGPLGSGMIDDFINRKKGKIKIKYLHPQLEKILQDTYGVIVYQEQVMRIASELAGFSLGQADILRKAMGKKKKEVMKKQHQLFINGAVKNGIEKKTAEEIYDLIAYFAGYGFNKSHSVSYAFVSYQTAYLKAHYPVEYMAALLTSIMQNTDKVVRYIKECQNMNLKILPPDINESLSDFTVVDHKAIRFGLAAVKNVGRGAIENIIHERTVNGVFKSLFDFCKRVDLKTMNRRVIESLIKCGAFDSTGNKRSQMLNILEKAISLGQEIQREKRNGQTNIFALMAKDSHDEQQDNISLPEVEEFTDQELLTMEKETLGFYLSHHPLDDYRQKLEQIVTANSSQLHRFTDKSRLVLGGIITSIRRKTTKNGNMMAYFVLEDLEGTIDVIVFPKTFEDFKEVLREENIVIVEGRMDVMEFNIKLLAESITQINEYQAKEKQKNNMKENKSANSHCLHIEADIDQLDEEKLKGLKKIFKKHPGKNRIIIHFKTPQKNYYQQVNDKIGIKYDKEVISEIEEFLENCKAWFGNTA